MSRDHEAPLPEVHDKVLEGAAIDEWFDGVRDCAELEEVVVRAGAWSDAPTAVTPETAAARLAEARQLLQRGASVQLRYRFEGSEWWDTLMPLGDGRVRLVRIDRGKLGQPG